MVFHYPFRQNRAAPADDARDSLAGQRNVLDEHTGMDGHVIDALLRLLLDHLEHHIDVQVLYAAHAAQCFINRHRTDRNGRSIDDRLSNARNVPSGGKIHHGIRAILHGIS